MIVDVDARLTYRFPRPTEVLLMVEAAEGGDQTILSAALVVSPMTTLVRKDAPDGEARGVIFTATGDVDIRYQATVETLDRLQSLDGLGAHAIRDLPPEVVPYLRPSRYCPSDTFEEMAKRQFAGLHGGHLAQAILDWVQANLAYRAGVSTAHSTAADTYDARAGVCRDFAHLAITLCRAVDLPARAVSAHAWALDPPDMHAVVEVFLEGAWRLADPTGLAPVNGLVRVASGRDAADIAFLSVFGEAELLHQSFQTSSPLRAAAE